VLAIVLLLPPLMKFEPRLALVDPPPVGPTIDLHLQDSKVQAELDSPLPIVAVDDPDGDFVRSIVPVAKNL
jgi:hypothetical protein